MIKPREEQAIQLLLEGKTYKQIGAALGISGPSAFEMIHKPEVWKAVQKYRSDQIKDVLSKSSTDLREMLRMEREIAQASADPKADAVRLKAIQGRIARHLTLQLGSENEEKQPVTDEAILAGLARIRDTRPDLLAAANLRADEPTITATVKPWDAP